MRIFSLLMVLGLLLGPAAPSAHADDAQRARELFQEGTRFFDLGQFDKAIDAWQSGYREKADPGFLYNIAQAYRLAGDLNKAVFFYKGFLRNSPKTHNRAEVEQRIAGLQKQIADQDASKEAPRARPEEANGAGNGAAAGTAIARPPATPATAPGASTTGSATGPPAPTNIGPGAAGSSPSSSLSSASPASGTVTTPAPPAGMVGPARRLDFGVGIGVDQWTSGVQGSADASLALMLTAGYRLGHDPRAPVGFRLGASLGYASLRDAPTRDTFVSFLLVPTLVVRASGRLEFFGELGIGVVAIGGLRASSALLDHTSMLSINGTQSLLEVRPALGLRVALTSGLDLFASIADDNSPKGAHFYQSINRTELLLGLSFRR